MSSPTRLLTLALVALASSAAGAMDTAATPATEGRADPPDSAYIQSTLARADASMFAGRLREARGLYRHLIRRLREAEQYERIALWNLAHCYLVGNDIAGAAATLDELALAAEKYGDPSLELLAIFAAAVYYQQLKRAELLAPRIARVRALLQSPAIPDSENTDYSRRLVSR
ncbi:MAG: hypothetical protein ABIZ91_14100 [Gemmatimonadaceae bacterium]